MPILNADLQTMSVFADIYATTGANSIVYGSLLSGDVSTVGANASITGNLVSVGAATIGAGKASVGGYLTSGGLATIGAGASVGSDILSSGAATIGANAYVGGNVTTNGVATTGDTSVVAGHVVAGGAASIGANAIVDKYVGAVGVISVAASAIVPLKMTLSLSPAIPNLTAVINERVVADAAQIETTQRMLNNLGGGLKLAPTMVTNTTLMSGVYSAASLSTTAGTTLTLDGQNKPNQLWVFNIANILVTGASTKVDMINAGPGSAVIWNTGGYASLGASSEFIGTVLAQDYISVGANALVSGSDAFCGQLLSRSYVSAGASAVIGSAGCVSKGVIDISKDGKPSYVPTTSAVPEPSTYAMLLAGTCLLSLRKRRAKNIWLTEKKEV
ncbi:ice-binding family protein [Actimicrobium sp. CCI2.3]|uniref:ice-binding family protein n=1 Tax=Actimicrobium sp. CCI2.3 TaxID=3048616 RepID=UPI002AB51891|nr:ice-binding family protein [Actimicrobium sp. CCI2.3]MDY7572928.1 ice-binding family protein [Actimicrobium sp. CCI2.3]MEB0020773.1 ice-binding family protein [Actimicrobium sp. CCI2.3]